MYVVLLVTMYCVLIAPSFAPQANLQQISSNPKTNTITISIPEVDDSGGPVRYIFNVSSNNMCYSVIM